MDYILTGNSNYLATGTKGVMTNDLDFNISSIRDCTK